MSITLLAAVTADGAGTGFVPALLGRELPVKAELVAYGTFGSGTVTFAQTPDGGTTWITLGTATAAGRVEVFLYHAGAIRASLAGSTAPTLTAKLEGLSAAAVANDIVSPTTVVLVATPDESDEGDDVTLTATVAGGLAGFPSGSVVFTDGIALDETVALVDGVATLVSDALVTATITATYAGDISYGGSSDTAAIVVTPTP